MKRSGGVWPGMIFGLLGLNMCIVALTVYFAHRDGSPAVEPNYYQNAVDWDRRQEQQRRSDLLGWTAEASLSADRSDAREGVLSVSVHDKDGRAVPALHMRIVGFHAAKAGDRAEVVLAESGKGYSGVFPLHGVGWYELRVEASKPSADFRTVLQVGLRVGGPRS